MSAVEPIGDSDLERVRALAASLVDDNGAITTSSPDIYAALKGLPGLLARLDAQANVLEESRTLAFLLERGNEPDVAEAIDSLAKDVEEGASALLGIPPRRPPGS